VYYDSIEYCLCCIDHFINLSIQMFLFDRHSNIESERKACDKDDDNNSSNKEYRNYCKFDSQDKLHKIIVYIMQSLQRIQNFRRLNKSLMLKRDYRVR
jgi:hypothetical protein